MKTIYSSILLFTLIFLPFLVPKLLSPNRKEIESKKCIKYSSIETSNNLSIDVYLCFGDVFRPQDMRTDIGFDLVTISCYFDPINFEGTQILITNPLLNSALYFSSNDSTEFYSLLDNLFITLEKSRSVIACYARNIGNDIPCKGDKITPYIWSVTQRENPFSLSNIKYLCALPIFSPHALFNKKPEQVRLVLKENVDAALMRLLNTEMDQLGSTVRSIAFAALGSTSHKGDSEAFMTFKEGFITICKSISKSKPPETLDKIYLVAYDKHQGFFKEDALSGLKSAAEYLTLKKIMSGDYLKITIGFYLIVWSLLTFLYYKNSNSIFMTTNRFSLILTITGFSGLLTSSTIGLTAIIINNFNINNYNNILLINGLIIIIGFIFLLTIGKWIFKNRKYT